MSVRHKNWICLFTLFLLLGMSTVTLAAEDFFTLVQSGSPERIVAAIKAGANVNQTTTEGKTPMMYAAQYNPNPEVLKVLYQAGALVNAMTKDGWTALMFAVKYNPNVYVTDTLLDLNANYNAMNNDGDTALLMAVKQKSFLLVKMLTQTGANVNVKDRSGLTPLMLSIHLNAGYDMVKMILNAGANPNIKDAYGLTALVHEIRKSECDLRIIEALLKEGADVNIRSASGMTPLMYALDRTGGDLQIVQLLINHGVDIHAKDNSGRNAFLYAVKTGNLTIIRRLIHIGARVNTVDNQGQNALIIAVNQRVSPEVMDFLLSCDITLDHQDQEGWSALMYAAKLKSRDIIKLLLKAGADVDRQNGAGETALIIAVMNRGNAELIDLFVSYDADVNHIDKNGGFPLHYSLRNRDLTSAGLLVKAGAAVEMHNHKGMTPLLLEVASNPAYEVVEFLIQAGADVNTFDKNGMTPLMYAVQTTEDVRTLNLIIRSGADVNRRDYLRGQTALMHAVRKTKSEEVILTLLHYGADATMRDDTGKRVVDILEENKALKGTSAYWNLQYLEPVKLTKELETFKSESTAGILAAVIPSAGHVYAERWFPKGTLFLLGEAAAAAVALSSSDETTITFGVIAFGALKIWEVYDAIMETQKYNQTVIEFNKRVEEYNQHIRQ